MTETNSELKSKITDTFLECIGVDALADTLKLLAQTAPSEQEKAMWIETYDILVGIAATEVLPILQSEN